MIDSVVINALLIDPSGVESGYDTNNDGIISSDDEYIEICNTSLESITDVSGWQIGDDDPPPYADYIIPDGTLLKPGECIVLVLDYCGDGDVIDTMMCTVPEGILDMNYSGTALLGNNGDVVTLSDSTGTQSCSVTYGEVLCQDIDRLDIPSFDIENCVSWGIPMDGCALLADGDSCTYFPLVLSIDASSFEVRRYESHKVHLSWWVESDDHTQEYYVEWRSESASNYSIIGNVAVGDDIDGGSQYTYLHDSPQNGINYYRLRQLSIQGDVSYSPVRSLLMDRKRSIHLVPTITTDDIQISGPDDEYIISIYDLQGRNYVEKMRLTNNQRISTSNLHIGHYIVAIFDGTTTRFKRFIKI